MTIRDWTFTHWWVRPVVKTWFSVYHRSVSYSGTNNIDWQKPIIFAPSHRNAFSDALCLILPTNYTDERFIYPLIRADAFGQNALQDWLLTTFHMMPVYRPRDRVNLKQKNEDVFSQCTDILARRRNLLIHPEGNCIAQKRVRPFKKGLARIAFGAEETHDFDLGVHVIPVGINYRQITAPRQGIHVRFGKPILVHDYQAEYQDHAASAITNFTRRLQKKVADLTVDIPSGKLYPLGINLMNLRKNTAPAFSERAAYHRDELKAYQKMIARLKEIGQESDQNIKQKVRQLSSLSAFLNRHQLSSHHTLTNDASGYRLIFTAIGLLLLSPLAFYGAANNLIPWAVTQKITAKAEEEQFISSARMTLGLLLFPFFYLLQSLGLWWLSGSWLIAVLYLISLPFAGLLALNWSEACAKWQQKWRLQKLSGQASEKFKSLVKKLLSDLQ